MDKINYFLVLEKRLGDYNIIDINKLDICKNYVINSLASIDSFTCMYKEDEIRKSIEKSNIITESYLLGNLKVISDMKHNLSILTKEKYDLIREFQTNNSEIDRDFKNKLYGQYKKIIDNNFKDKSFIQGMLDRFKLALKNSDKKEIFAIIEELPYPKIRPLYLSVYNELNRRKEENLRKLEKLNDQ